MIKGDLRKKQILETAEELFTMKGYEATGVQDILDRLHLSKGSFYHHFESKELVLQTICENRAAKAAFGLSNQHYSDGMVRMNQLLTGMIPFSGEGLNFLKMILPVFVLPEGKSIRIGYQEALKRAWYPLTEQALILMIEQKQAYTVYPQVIAGIILDLVNDLWAQISQEMILSEKECQQPANPGILLALVEPYRISIENVLSTSYGSIRLLNLEDLAKVTNEIHNWWL